jgi:hypothetical protein
MTGAVALAALVGLASLLAGVVLGWYLRRRNNWCPDCGGNLTCLSCGTLPIPPRRSASTSR